jgi:hypothetical protein
MNYMYFDLSESDLSNNLLMRRSSIVSPSSSPHGLAYCFNAIRRA